METKPNPKYRHFYCFYKSKLGELHLPSHIWCVNHPKSLIKAYEKLKAKVGYDDLVSPESQRFNDESTKFLGHTNTNNGQLKYVFRWCDYKEGDVNCPDCLAKYDEWKNNPYVSKHLKNRYRKPVKKFKPTKAHIIVYLIETFGPMTRIDLMRRVHGILPGQAAFKKTSNNSYFAPSAGANLVTVKKIIKVTGQTKTGANIYSLGPNANKYLKEYQVWLDSKDKK